MNNKKLSGKVIEIVLSSDLGNLSSLSVDKVAKELRMNPSFLSREFKKDTHILLSEYIRNEKIRRAELLLELSYDLKVGEISRMIGFETLHYFRKLFREKNFELI